MLEGKAIIVTGAGSGIGRASAKQFAAFGAKVVVNDVNTAAGEAVVAEVKAQGGTACYHGADVARERDVEDLVAYAVRQYGKLDGAFNNAGIGMSNKSLADLTEEEFRHVHDVNVVGMFLCLKHEMRAMKETGGGAIVNAGSAAGILGMINAGEYVASKHAIHGLTRSAALEGALIGVRVNATAPGVVITPLTEELFKNPVFAPAVDRLLTRHPIGRFGEPIDVANAAAWLLSDLSSWVTGSVLSVDGGVTMAA
jgi:NAD(P)-dependent dehydrogenase (short-subunit alcohol dehydrogenase family)